MGVCQDYAHLAVALCRSIGIPARYVSGYLFTTDDATGADPEAEAVRVQTHAWFEAAVPGVGLARARPDERSQEVGLRHVKIGHGRDYDDVPPLRGVFGGEATPSLGVAVEIRRLTPKTVAADAARRGRCRAATARGSSGTSRRAASSPNRHSSRAAIACASWLNRSTSSSSAAARAATPSALYGASAGLTVAMIEKDKVGGTCLHRGCIPAKEFLETAATFRHVANAKEFGIKAGQPIVDFAVTQARKQKVVDTLYKGLLGLVKSRKIVTYARRRVARCRPHRDGEG